MAEISTGVTNLIETLQQLVSSPSITNDLATVNTTLEQYRLLGEKLNRKLDPLADSITNSLANANRAMAQVQKAAENLRTFIDPDSATRGNLDHALQELAGALQSLSVLLDFLKQHPNALITGRQIPEKNP
jgi:paraquat-inducible protein B